VIFVLAKFAALAILFGLALLLGAAADYLYTTILFDAPAVGGFGALVGLMYLWLLGWVALALLASTLGRSMTAAGGIAFLLVVIVLLAGSFTKLAPGTLLDWGRALAIETDAPARWGALIVTLLVVLGSVAGSALALRQQEIG
jgi:hypothetical protein